MEDGELKVKEDVWCNLKANSDLLRYLKFELMQYGLHASFLFLATITNPYFKSLMPFSLTIKKFINDPSHSLEASHETNAATMMLVMMHLCQIVLIIIFLHPRFTLRSSGRDTILFKFLIFLTCLLLSVSGVTFIFLCVQNTSEWNIFTNKMDVTLLVEGKFEMQFTYLWFKIELFAIPSQIFYYYFAYRFFLAHRKNKGMIALKFVATVKKKLAKVKR